MSEDKFLEVFEKKMCNIKQTCIACNVSREWYYRHCKRGTFKKRVDAILEGMVDDVESQLYLNIMAGKEASIFYFLKTKGKHRGWAEVHESNTDRTIEWE